MCCPGNPCAKPPIRIPDDGPATPNSRDGSGGSAGSGGTNSRPDSGTAGAASMTSLAANTTSDLVTSPTSGSPAVRLTSVKTTTPALCASVVSPGVTNPGAQPPSQPGATLSVLDVNKGLVVTPGVTSHEFSNWSVDLQAQVSGATVSTYSWNVSQASDATSVTGQSTYELKFTWANFTGARGPTRSRLPPRTATAPRSRKPSRSRSTAPRLRPMPPRPLRRRPPGPTCSPPTSSLVKRR